KMDIEVTKVRSDNFIEFYIDKVEKKIYRDITQKTREIEDLEKKLYVTTYLKPNTKTNTIHDELPYEIVTRDGRRYLEISYSKEPEKIYLWVLKKDKVQKLYTGVLKENLNLTKNIIQQCTLDTMFDYSIGETSYFTLKSANDFSEVSNDNFNLISFSGNMTKAWTTPTLKFIRMKITVDNSVALVISGKSDAVFSVTHAEIDFKHEFLNPNYKISFTPKKDFQKIMIQYTQSHNASFNHDLYVDYLIINGTKKIFSLKATPMDFGEFFKTSGASSESSITVVNGGGLDYSISNIPKTIKIYKKDDNEVSIDVFLDEPVKMSKTEFKINGLINEPTNGEYVEGIYNGTIPITVTVNENISGGRF
ncbi:MAG: hypothetical protein ACRC0G_11555, partial [Fusobacteriaceae bacterium]